LRSYVAETGARLHLGFYRLCRGVSGLVLGGVGLAVDLEGVATRVVFEPREGGIEVTAPEACLSDAEEAATAASRRYGVTGRLVVERCIPRHVGLGSTTQLVLAIHAVVARAAGVEDLEAVVGSAGRGFYSGVGAGVFLRGGLVIDAGLRGGGRASRPMAWAWPPSSWGLVVVVPSVEPRRLMAEDALEDEAMRGVLAGLPPGPGACAEPYSALLDLLLPGAALPSFDMFVAGVEALEAAAARLFGGAQGGAMCCSEAEAAAAALRGVGARGVGQSSWGPSVYGFFSSRGAAARAAAVLRRRLGGGFRVLAGAVRRRGATLGVA